MLIGSINILSNAARRLEEEVSNAGAPPHGDQVPLFEKNANVDQPPANPPPMTEEDIRAILYQISLAINTQAQAATVQSQAMTAQANREIAPRAHQQVSTTASPLRDFTRMTLLYSMGLMMRKTPKN